MSLSDCIKCWDTPCTCGWDYRNYTKEHRIEQASVVLGVDIKILKEIEDKIPLKHPIVNRKE